MPISGIDKAKTIGWNLFKCLLAFYSGSYIGASIAHGSYRLDAFDAAAPFDFSNWPDLQQCCSFATQTKINLLSVFSGYLAVLLLLVASVRRAHWLFTLLLTLIHIIISCIVVRNFPLTYTYWLTIGVLWFGCLSIADICVFFINEKTTPTHVHPSTIPSGPVNEPNSSSL